MRDPVVSVDAAGRLMVDYRGYQELPERPLVLQCDFCCEMVQVLHCRLTRGFCMRFAKGNLDYEGGGWNACEDCELAVAMRDPHATTVNFATSALIRGVEVSADHFNRTRLIHRVVMDCFEVEAPVLIWRTGEPFPVRWS